jgi:hypothetical protein
MFAKGSWGRAMLRVLLLAGVLLMIAPKLSRRADENGFHYCLRLLGYERRCQRCRLETLRAAENKQHCFYDVESISFQFLGHPRV